MKTKSLRATALRVAGLVIVFFLIAISSSCAMAPSRRSLPLVRVLEVVPAAVELGDRVFILGSGFSPGQQARVTFRGTLHRPGERAMRGTELVVLADTLSPTRLEFALDDSTQALFCGAGDGATHTTFEGAIEVAFVSADRDTPPSVGFLENATFDVRPNPSPLARRRQDEGERVLAWLGVKAESSPAGLVIEAVEPGSRAQTVGIAPGDVVTGFDGVRVASPADAVPPPEERTAAIDLLLEHPEGHRQTRIVALEGLHRPSPVDFAGALLCVFCALFAVWFFSVPPRPAAATAVQRLVTRLRTRIGAAQGNPSLTRAAFLVARRVLAPSGLAAVVEAIVCGVFALLPFGQWIAAARFEVWWLFVVALACLAGAALVHGRSVWSGLRAAAAVAWLHVPAAVAVASAVVLTGSLRLWEIGQSQGGWPWDWLAFRSPVSLFALGLLLDSARIEPRGNVAQTPLGMLLEEVATSGQERRGPWLEAACRTHRIIIAGLASVLFLGGWQLPGSVSNRPPYFAWTDVAGAACVLAKTSFLLYLAAWMRWLLPPRHVNRAMLPTALSIPLLAIIAIAATAAWHWWPPPSALDHLVSGSLTIAVAVAALALAHRLRHGLASPEGNTHLSAFL